MVAFPGLGRPNGICIGKTMKTMKNSAFGGTKNGSVRDPNLDKQLIRNKFLCSWELLKIILGQK